MRHWEISESAAIGAIVDLSKNWGNFNRLIGKIVDTTPNGKLKIQIVLADPMPNKKGAVSVGDVVTIAPNYIKRSAIVNPQRS